MFTFVVGSLSSFPLATHKVLRFRTKVVTKDCLELTVDLQLHAVALCKSSLSSSSCFSYFHSSQRREGRIQQKKKTLPPAQRGPCARWTRARRYLFARLPQTDCRGGGVLCCMHYLIRVNFSNNPLLARVADGGGGGAESLITFLLHRRGLFSVTHFTSASFAVVDTKTATFRTGRNRELRR